MKLHKWKDVAREKLGVERMEKLDREVAEDLAAMDLRALREAMGMTQDEMAKAIDIAQAQVSRLERRDDHRISTLRRYVAALGGKLEIAAVVKGKRVPLTNV